MHAFILTQAEVFLTTDFEEEEEEEDNILLYSTCILLFFAHVLPLRRKKIYYDYTIRAPYLRARDARSDSSMTVVYCTVYVVVVGTTREKV